MEDYASGRRQNEIMTPIAKQLSGEERQAVAIYYAEQSPSLDKPVAVRGSAQAIQRGGVLSAIGDRDLGIQACQNCHGPEGRGLPPIYPYLAGQHEAYITQQLRFWKEGRRGGDEQDIMRAIAGRMTDQDIAAVAAYFANLPPPTPAEQIEPTAWAEDDRATGAMGSAPGGQQ